MKTKISEILEKKGNTVVSIDTGSSLLDAVKMMNKNKVGSLLVMDKKSNIAGIITERDVLHEVDKLNGSIDKVTVDDVMTKNIIIGLPSDDVAYIMGIMTKNRIRHMPIMEQDKIAGIISIGDLVKSRLDDSEFENRMLSQYIQSG